MARKRKYINRHTLKALAEAQLSNDEISAALRVSWDTIARRYAEAIKVWRNDGVGSMRRRLYMTAMKDEPIFVVTKEGPVAVGTKPGTGAVTSMIFFLKNFGGMSDGNKDNGEQQKLTRDGLPVQRDEPITAHKPN